MRKGDEIYVTEENNKYLRENDRKLSTIAQWVNGNTAGVKIERGNSQSIRASLLDRQIIIQNDFSSLALKIKHHQHLVE